MDGPSAAYWASWRFTSKHNKHTHDIIETYTQQRNSRSQVSAVHQPLAEATPSQPEAQLPEAQLVLRVTLGGAKARRRVQHFLVPCPRPLVQHFLVMCVMVPRGEIEVCCLSRVAMGPASSFPLGAQASHTHTTRKLFLVKRNPGSASSCIHMSSLAPTHSEACSRADAEMDA